VSDPARNPRPMPSSRGRLVGIVVLVAAVAAGAFGTWYLFGRSAPDEVSLATPSASALIGTPTTTDAAGSPGASPTAGGGTTGDVTGTWAVDPAVGSFADFSGSFVGYRVQEELATIGGTTAVGRTPDVTGTLTVEGNGLVEAEFTVDLTTLESDDSRRDGQLRRQALETEQFPTARFRLTGPVDLGELATGTTIEVTVPGDLTLHGVTRAVEIPMQARLADGVVTVVGSLPIAFADYEIDAPRAGIVLSVDDNGVMEFQLHFTQR